MQYVTKQNPKGRPMTREQAAIDRAVQRYIAEHNEPFTVKEAAAHIRKRGYQILVALRRLETLGAVTRVGTKRTAKGRGRPSVQFQAIV